MIKRNYIQRIKKEFIATLLYLIITFILFYFDLKYLAIIPAFFFLAYSVNLIRGHKFHRKLIEWLDKNTDAQIFIYSSKKEYSSLIEKEILPILNNTIFIVKNDNAKISGDLSQSIYQELHQIMNIKELPLFISFQGNQYNKIPLKKDFINYKNKKITELELIYLITNKINLQEIR